MRVRSSVAGTTAACSAVAPSSTERWTPSSRLADYRHLYTQERSLHHFVSVCDVLGAILLYRIPRVIVGENVTFMGEEELLRSRGVTVLVLQDPRCIELMKQFIIANPSLWNEDIGV